MVTIIIKPRETHPLFNTRSSALISCSSEVGFHDGSQSNQPPPLCREGTNNHMTLMQAMTSFTNKRVKPISLNAIIIILIINTRCHELYTRLQLSSFHYSMPIILNHALSLATHVLYTHLYIYIIAVPE